MEKASAQTAGNERWADEATLAQFKLAHDIAAAHESGHHDRVIALLNKAYIASGLSERSIRVLPPPEMAEEGLLEYTVSFTTARTFLQSRPVLALALVSDWPEAMATTRDGEPLLPQERAEPGEILFEIGPYNPWDYDAMLNVGEIDYAPRAVELD